MLIGRDNSKDFLKISKEETIRMHNACEKFLVLRLFQLKNLNLMNEHNQFMLVDASKHVNHFSW